MSLISVKMQMGGQCICPSCVHAPVCETSHQKPYPIVGCGYHLPATQHAHWIAETLLDGHAVGECSHCHSIRTVDSFCSSCGAVMDE